MSAMTDLGASPEQQQFQPARYSAFESSQGRWHRPALLGALLCAAAGVLVLVGSFVPLFVGEAQAASGLGVKMSITGWDFQLEAGGTSTTRTGAVPSNGIALVVGAMVLLGAALLGLIAASRSVHAPSRRLSGVVAVAGAAFVAGTVLTVGLQVISWFDSFRPTGVLATGQDTSTEVSVGFGFWLLVVAAAAAIVAAILAWVAPRPETAPETPENPDPSGYATPVVAQLPENPAAG